MSKKIFVLGFFFTLSFMNAQNKNIIDISQYSEEQINKMDQTLPKDGWVLIKMNEEQVLLNYSNEDYVLLLNLDCPNPSYNIEYSSNYRDGDYGGIDLEDWIRQINSHLDWLTSHLTEVENIIEKIKRIVPLVDEDLGMHDAPSTSVS